MDAYKPARVRTQTRDGDKSPSPYLKMFLHKIINTINRDKVILTKSSVSIRNRSIAFKIKTKKIKQHKMFNSVRETAQLVNLQVLSDNYSKLLQKYHPKQSVIPYFTLLTAVFSTMLFGSSVAHPPLKLDHPTLVTAAIYLNIPFSYINLGTASIWWRSEFRLLGTKH
jgi:hypothetical protein